MSEGQAGVSAEAVTKLVEKWRKNEDNAYRQCIYEQCAEELEQALATAPPEQAASEDSWSRLERHTKALAKVQPQAASAGALDGLIAKGKVGWMDSTDFSCELGHALGGNKVFPDAEDCAKNHLCIEIPDAAWPCKAQRVIVFDADELNAALAAHDQKVRAEVLEEIASQHSLYPGAITIMCSCGKAFNHVAFVAAEEWKTHIRSLAAPAPAASKPEAGK